MRIGDQKRHKVEFGDFQTPLSLARDVCSLVARDGFYPASVLEPTCGTGSFLQATLETFPEVSRAIGLDINPTHVTQARQALVERFPGAAAEVRQADFFTTNWDEVVAALADPILIIGNPPWVTNAALGTLGSNNIPAKENLDSLGGMDALTGKSNFDISEWMLRKNLEWLRGRDGLLAMLCKTTVARKVLRYAWQNDVPIVTASLYLVNAQEHFGASVDACLLLIRVTPAGGKTEDNKMCAVYPSLDAPQPDRCFGLQDGMLVADIALYRKWKDLVGDGLRGWRSGIKHDCSPVFELRREAGGFVNGLGETVDVEPEVLFPLLKSSDLASRGTPRRWLLVPQRSMGDDPEQLRWQAPKTWNYLVAHAHLLDHRKSSVYKSRPRFSIFGVGPYTFAPWKVAISGLYKRLEFVLIAPFEGRPVVFDDTCYFFPCYTEAEANCLHRLVMARPAQEFWASLTFWDAKRPITAQILNSLDLMRLAKLLGKEDDEVTRRLAERQLVEYANGAQQGVLFWESVLAA